MTKKGMMTTRLQVYQPIMIACWNESSIIAQGDIKEKPHFRKLHFRCKIYDFFNLLFFEKLLILILIPINQNRFGLYLMRLFLMELV